MTRWIQYHTIIRNNLFPRKTFNLFVADFIRFHALAEYLPTCHANGIGIIVKRLIGFTIFMCDLKKHIQGILRPRALSHAKFFQQVIVFSHVRGELLPEPAKRLFSPKDMVCRDILIIWKEKTGFPLKLFYGRVICFVVQVGVYFFIDRSVFFRTPE